MTYVPVYVPKLAALASIPPGAGIVGSQSADDKVLIDYEDNRAEADNIRTYADRVRHAADRHRTGYPTARRLLVDDEDLMLVGDLNIATGIVEVSNSEALEAWLAEAAGGVLPDLDLETRCSGGLDG
jgi:hypothetical protein